MGCHPVEVVIMCVHKYEIKVTLSMTISLCFYFWRLMRPRERLTGIPSSFDTTKWQFRSFSSTVMENEIAQLRQLCVVAEY